MKLIIVSIPIVRIMVRVRVWLVHIFAIVLRLTLEITAKKVGD